MGATGWSFFVPYQADMEQVLEGLKQQEFERGEYEKPGVEWECLSDFGIIEAKDDVEREEIIKQYGLQSLRRPLAEVGGGGFRDWLRALNNAPRVKTREDLEVLRQFSSSGTSSIIDIDRVVPERGQYGLFPLPPEERKRYYGTENPTRTEVEQKQGSGWSLSENPHGRGEGFYVVLYRNGLPDEIYIEGLLRRLRLLTRLIKEGKACPAFMGRRRAAFGSRPFFVCGLFLLGLAVEGVELGGGDGDVVGA